jgi:glutamine amidotransferase
MIIIVDYGMGNLGSIFNMFKKIGVEAKISSDVEEISSAEKLVLPGVGSYDAAMKRINELGMIDTLNNLANEKKIPILGICLGMQLLMESSEEGKKNGLGWIKGRALGFTKRINTEYKIPHMGWNDVKIKNKNKLTDHFSDEIRFYFVHSYFVKAEHEANSMFECKYGLDFDAGVYRDNIFGVQFHPEKSHKYGMQLFKNFSNL